VKAIPAIMCAANAEEKMAMQTQEHNCTQYSDERTLMTGVKKIF